MNKQLLIEYRTFQILKEDLNESLKKNGTFTVRGVLTSKDENKNGNGRIYPKAILEKEVDRYIKECVNTKKAMGELDHPQCFTETAHAMTEDGWKKIKDITKKDKVFTLNEDDVIELQTINEKIDESYQGEMYKLNGEHIDTIVTPNHRFLLKDECNKSFFKTAKELYDLSLIEKRPYLIIPNSLNQDESKSPIDFRFLTIEKIENYNGKVYCLSVDNGIFFCMDNNKTFWTGNSEVINLKNVSHNITECHWEGDDLIGTVEILTTPSGNILRELFKCGVNVGISSRALGSVKRVDETTVEVQDDLSLICFDFVSNPSCQKAWMKPTEPINESISHNIQYNYYSKIDRIIHDILTEIK